MLITENLNKAIDRVILAEGHEYTNHPADRGGPTKYGVTLATLRGIPKYSRAEPADVAALTLTEARNIYLTLYATQFTMIENPLVFNFLFNAAVQHGSKTAAKMLQRTLGVEDDGVIGPQTRNMLNLALQTPVSFLAKLVAERCEYYANILMRDHSQRVFAAGWLNRLAKDLT